MAAMLQKTEEQIQQLEKLDTLTGSIGNALAPYGDCVDLARLEEFTAGFRARAEDFFSKGRKFTLAVIGQVKAGKSSFLNTLLFGGEPLLPRASTPKTTALTCIEYAKTNKVVIEYYTPDEWAGLEQLAASPLDTPQARAARESISRAVDQGTPVEQCFQKPKETISFDSPEEMGGRLNSYVGEDGLFTPLVKSVTLRMALPGLRGLSVVDTPGLNDPVISRVEKTRTLIETCDAVFFLSHSSFFLDRNDLFLLTSLLPHKGVASLTVVGSQFDSAVVDILPDCVDLEDAVQEARVTLRRHAAKAVDSSVSTLRASKAPQTVLDVVERCRRPVFVSALLEAAAVKLAAGQALTAQEQLVLDNLGTPPTEMLVEIGNFAQVQAEFSAITRSKDRILAARAQDFGVVAKADLRRYLNQMREQTQEKMRQCKALQGESLARQKELTAEIGEVRRQIEQAFGEYLLPLEQELSDALFYLLGLEKEWGALEERTDYEVRSKVKLVSATKLFAPWTWGRKDEIYTSEQQAYTYLDPEDVHRNAAALADAAERFVTQTITRFQDTAALENRLLEIAADLFAKSSAGNSALREQIRAATRYLSWTKQSPLPQLPKPPSEFGDKVIGAPERQKLQEAVFAAIAEVLAVYRKNLHAFSDHLREESRRAAQELGDRFCAELIDRRSDLIAQAAQATRELDRCTEAVELLEKYLFQ